MKLVLDAGAFIAVERGDRLTMELIKADVRAGRAPVTHGGVIGQVWRGGVGKQARLALLVSAVAIAPLAYNAAGPPWSSRGATSRYQGIQ